MGVGRCVVLGVMLLGFGPAVHAVNKCVDGAGRVTYTDEPCSEGRVARRLVLPPPPDPAEVAAAQLRAERMVAEAKAFTARQEAEMAARRRQQAQERQAEERAARQAERLAEADYRSVVRPLHGMPRPWLPPLRTQPLPLPERRERPVLQAPYPPR